MSSQGTVAFKQCSVVLENVLKFTCFWLENAAVDRVRVSNSIFFVCVCMLEC